MGRKVGSKTLWLGKSQTFGHNCSRKWCPEGGSKLPAANSRSGSTEGHGASGDLFAMRGAVGRVRVFFEVGCEKMAGGEINCEKDFKLRNHILKFEITCNLDKFSLTKNDEVPKLQDLPPPLDIGRFTDQYRLLGNKDVMIYGGSTVIIVIIVL